MALWEGACPCWGAQAQAGCPGPRIVTLQKALLLQDRTLSWVSGVCGEEDFVPHSDEGPDHPAPFHLPGVEGTALSSMAIPALVEQQVLSVHTQGRLVSALL